MTIAALSRHTSGSGRQRWCDENHIGRNRTQKSRYNKPSYGARQSPPETYKPCCMLQLLSPHTHTQIHARSQILMRHSLQPEVWPSQTFSSFFSRNSSHFPAAWARVASRHQFFISPVIVFYFTPLIVGDMFIFYDVTGHSAICSLFSFPVLHRMAAITPHLSPLCGAIKM